MTGRMLAVDPGEKRIGIALSDPNQVIATPLCIIAHLRLEDDCRRIEELALEHHVETILVGQALGSDGEDTPSSRHAQKIVEKLKEYSSVKIILWDESFSTQTAKMEKVKNGNKRKKRKDHVDADAAAVILQDYLNCRALQEGR